MITTESKTLESLYIDVTDMEIMPAEILADYRENGAPGVVDMGTFSAEETKKMTDNEIAIINSKADGWTNPELLKGPKGQGGACSSCIKKLDDGTVVMGRNMDLPNGFGPVVIYRTKGNGKDTYDTVNLGYNSPALFTFDQLVEVGGIPKPIFGQMAMGVTDTLNSEGLYLQYNMREAGWCPCKGTNPKSKKRVASFNLNRLLGDYCATIDEALDYLSELDIYDPYCAAFDWSMAIGMMDKTGRYGVCEFTNDKIIWNEGRPGFACGQGNFYWNEEGFKANKLNTGFGRWHKLMEYFNEIESLEDMEKAMERIRYSNLYTDGSTAKDWKVDWMTEMNDKTPHALSTKFIKMIDDWSEQYGIKLDEKEYARAKAIADKQDEENSFWNNEFLLKPHAYYDVITVMDLFTKVFVQTPLDIQMASGLMEVSSISYVADNKNPEYKLRCFEMNDIFYVGMNETRIERHPSTKCYGPK